MYNTGLPGPACKAGNPSVYNTGLPVVSMYGSDSISVQHWYFWGQHYGCESINVEHGSP